MTTLCDVHHKSAIWVTTKWCKNDHFAFNKINQRKLQTGIYFFLFLINDINFKTEIFQGIFSTIIIIIIFSDQFFNVPLILQIYVQLSGQRVSRGSSLVQPRPTYARIHGTNVTPLLTAQTFRMRTIA